MRASVFALCLVLLAGCDLLGDDGTPLVFRTVSSTLTDSLSTDRLAGQNGLLQSAEAADAFREQTGLSRALVPEVDWAREALYVTTPVLRANEVFLVETVRLRGGSVDIQSVIRRGSGPVGERRRAVVAVAIEGVPPNISGYSSGTRVEGGLGSGR